jgi:hypothetical protein
MRRRNQQQRYAPPKRAKHPIRAWLHTLKPRTLAVLIWSALVGVMALVSFWAGVLRPVIHVDPYTQLNPDSPFSERFHVANDGIFGVNDVTFGCLVINVKREFGGGGGVTHESQNLISASPGYIDTLGSSTVDCPYDRAIRSPDLRYLEAEVEIRMQFRPFLDPWNKTSCFRFLGVLDSQKHVEWTYENNKCSDTSEFRGVLLDSGPKAHFPGTGSK